MEDLVLTGLPRQVFVIDWIISRSEQAPGSEFHPRDESEKNYCGFLGPSWSNKKVNHVTYVPCGSFELLLSNVAYQMKEKLMNKNKFFFFSILKSNLIEI